MRAKRFQATQFRLQIRVQCRLVFWELRYERAVYVGHLLLASKASPSAWQRLDFPMRVCSGESITPEAFSWAAGVAAIEQECECSQSQSSAIARFVAASRVTSGVKQVFGRPRSSVRKRHPARLQRLPAGRG